MAGRWKNDLGWADVTPKAAWLNRRQIMAGAGAAAFAGLAGMAHAKLGAVFLAAGQPERARRMWQRTNLYIERHGEIPANAILEAWAVQLAALMRQGEFKQARVLAAEARSLSGPGTIPDRILSPFTEEVLDAAIAAYRDGESDPVAEAGDPPRPVLLQPL